MQTNTQPHSLTDDLGNTAVDGILAGFLGGALMLALLIGLALLSGQTAVNRLALFDPGHPQSPLRGLVSHLAVSGIYGLIYGVGSRAVGTLWPKSGRFHPLLGLLFGLLLALVARLWLLPASESPLLTIPFFSFMLAHLVYGLAVGLQIGRRLGKPA